MDVDPKRTTNQDIIQIGMMDAPVEKDGKRPVILNNKLFQLQVLSAKMVSSWFNANSKEKTSKVTVSGE
jgi:hypothetical protein